MSNKNEVTNTALANLADQIRELTDEQIKELSVSLFHLQVTIRTKTFQAQKGAQN